MLTTGDAAADFCASCGLTRCDRCDSCATRKTAFVHDGPSCGTGAVEPPTAEAAAGQG